MLLQLEQPADRETSLDQFSFFVKAILSVARICMGVQLQLSAFENLLGHIAFVRVDMGFFLRFLCRLFFCGHRWCFRSRLLYLLGNNPLPAGVLVGMLFQRTDKLRAVAVLSMGVLFQGTGKISFLIHTGFRVGMLLGCAGKYLAVASFAVCMLFLCADQVALHRLLSGFTVLYRIFPLALCFSGLAFRGFRVCALAFCAFCFCVLTLCIFRFLAFCHLGSLQFAYQGLHFLVAFFRMLMRLHLFQRTYRPAFRIIAVIIMDMNNIIRIDTDQLFRLLFVIAFFRMLMHLVFAFQHFHLMRHSLTVQL